ncbi:hypothetical protein [Paenibacillus thalictri]|uniref:Uncharacterized protein n=1 Tax=Paenibacillus thalictri TaxID=2527873 RepID=A0A4Q9DN05_9BACL|nr:hypothetical protein [Paenibacillus thalictri]TBL77310.1 hypothetical protein EYB31_17685 [Paenibacillus thalictri]
MVFNVRAIKGMFMGIATTGGWLLADLLLPEPWGDFLLFAAMAVVNAIVGWWLVTLSDQRDRAQSQVIDTRSAAKFEES